MKTGLIDVDGHHFPNLALMKLANYHRQQGDIVEWVNHFEYYDKVYQSKVFTFTPDVSTFVRADEIVKGGTGYKMYNDLFCDDTEPDYSIYPQYSHAYGFLTRGCVRDCNWCIVPQKEGKIRAYRDIETVLQGRKTAILMDNNVLASEHGLQQLERIADLKCKVDFNQGLDSRLITNDTAQLLSKIKWIRFIRFACDT
ncbi:MAG: radical SAM protein, partial [Tannerella sp.]|nr:radical SAM protein [Tannerella sp.]